MACEHQWSGCSFHYHRCCLVIGDGTATQLVLSRPASYSKACNMPQLCVESIVASQFRLLLNQLCVFAEPPAVKAAPKRRRGGKHRHKGLAADAGTEPAAEAAAEATAEAGTSGKEHASSARGHAASDGALSDKLAGLQLDRLASNAAAGTWLVTYLVMSMSSDMHFVTLPLRNLVYGTLGLTCTHNDAHTCKMG